MSVLSAYLRVQVMTTVKSQFLFIILSLLALSTSQAKNLKEKNMERDLRNIDISSLDGKTLNIDSYREGKALYLKFWATWCIPCLKQMPHLQNSYEKYSDKIKFLAINVDINDNIEDIKAVVRRNNLTMPVVIDKSGDLTSAVGLTGTPLHVLLDPNGKIIFKGHDASSELDSALLNLSKGIKTAPLKSTVNELNSKVNLTLKRMI